MGLFDKKNPCAICGGKVKGLFPSKIDGQYICSDCYGLVDLPEDVAEHMTIEDFRGYMAFREENNLLRQRFQTTKKVDFGWLDTKFMFDFNNRLFCMDKHLKKTIFQGKDITSFIIKEDSVPLFEGSARGLLRYTSSVPERAMEMAPQINQFLAQVELQRDAERLMDRLDDGKSNNSAAHQILSFEMPAPLEKFYIEIYFEHPYWSVFTNDMTGPRFNNSNPSVDDYLREYNENIETMEQLAQALMEIAFPGAPEKTIDRSAAASVSVDAVEEIKRFKTLLDQGIITEEEFAAKKRQLLGIDTARH